MKIKRETGEFPISVSTSIALETLMQEKVPPKELWINLRTVFRNLYTTLDKETRDSLKDQDLCEDFMEEILLISSTVDMLNTVSVSIVFYDCTYRGLNSQFKYATFKNPTTKLQLKQAEFELKCLEYFMKHKPDLTDFRQFDVAIKGKDADAWMITHLAVDLLSRRFFSKLILLESHTGVTKPPSKWHTKLYRGKDYFRLPFNELTIQIYGENNYFKGFPTRAKEDLYALATKYRWTPLTTRSKIRADLNHLTDKPASILYKEILSNRVK